MLIVKRSFKEIERDLTMLKEHNFHNQQIREWKRPKKLRKKKPNKKPSLGLTSIFFFKWTTKSYGLTKRSTRPRKQIRRKKTRYNYFSFVDFRYYMLASDIFFKFLIEWRYFNSYRKTPLTERPSVNFLI